MNRRQVLDALNHIPDTYIESAEKRLEDTRARKSHHRTATALLVAAILLLTTFATAFAAIPQFRENVLTLLHISLNDTPIHEPQADHDVGLDMTVSRLHMEPDYFPGLDIPRNVYVQNGLFLRCRDEIEYKRGSHYDVWEAVDGELIPLTCHEVNSTFSYHGLTYHFDYEWAGNGTNSVLAYLREPDGSMDDPAYHIISLPGHSESMLVWLNLYGTPDENGWPVGQGLYPVLLDLASGDCLDFAAGLPLEQIGQIDSIWLPKTPNIDKAFFCDMENEDRAHWYGDLAAGELYNLDVLCGARLSGCCLVDEQTIVCWALTGGEFDEEAAEAYEREMADYVGGVPSAAPSLPKTDFGDFALWQIALDTMQVRQIDSIPATILTNPWAVWWGTEQSCSIGTGAVAMQNFDSTFILLRNEDNSASVLDLHTGEEKLVDGFAFPIAQWPNLECQISPNGEKVLLYDRTDAAHFSVLDFASGRWINAAIENLTGTQPQWFDNERILVQECGIAPTETGEYWFHIYNIG